jgi:micrococcal nuclease
MSVASVMLQLVRTFLSIPLVLLLLVACTTATVTVTGDRRAPVSPSPSGASNGKPLATVTRVVDGDTAHVLFRGKDVTVRFIGVDTPETVAPGQPIECYGTEASHFTTRQLTGKQIRLEFDVDRIDPFGRTLAYLWMRDGSLFNETLVRRGFATVATYPPDTRYVDRFEASKRAAKAAGRGQWGAC